MKIQFELFIVSLVTASTLVSATSTYPPLALVGDEGEPADKFPLGRCEGDCDNDWECQWGLNCFQRSADEAVPGCDGAGVDGEDYCILPFAGTLVLKGNEDEPATAFPLGECEGDCDVDEDCEGDLLCFQRDGKEPVPGCTGDGANGADYCYRHTSGEPFLELIGDNGIPASAFPLGLCKADCDNDKDCEWGLICQKRDGDETVRGCTVGTAISGEDYCITPLADELVLMGDEDVPASAFPLGKCQGDCDADSDCAGDLVCFKRDGTTEVPGCTGEGMPNADYCYDPADDPPPSSSGELELVGDNGIPASAFPLQLCQGDCDNDKECDWGLICQKREGDETVRDCPGTAISGEDYCISPLADELVLMGDEDVPASAFPLGKCQGDCDGDGDCAGDLVCFQRDGTTEVPGCTGEGNPNSDYCYDPADDPPPSSSGELALVGDEGSPASAFPLQLCQGDCDDDKECDWGLICQQRSGDETVRGCTGNAVNGEDYCIAPLNDELVLMGDEDVPASAFPLGKCQGDCDGDADCAGDLVCFQRSGTTEVPGCTGEGMSNADYCYDPADDTSAPPPPPPPAPTPPGTVTYRPGEATVHENGLILSTGLTSRIIATKNTRVQYDTGGQSSEDFHTAPDGAAVFADEQTGGWIYVSNAESRSEGGVGAITFNANGEVIGYKRILSNTRRNCGGGKTFWNTWLTCEEDDGGQVWEVDPWGNSPGRETIMGRFGAEYESAAYDNRDPDKPTFYITVDESDGPLVKFTPDENAVATARSTGDYSNLLHATGSTVKYEYFKIDNFDSSTGEGTYSWTDDIAIGQQSASQYFRNGEGIDIRNGIIYFTSKVDKYLFIIDIDNLTFTRSSTDSGAFDSQPDQVARVLDSSGNTAQGDDILYFCEDGGSECGVHGRDSSGNFFTILQDKGNSYGGETTGLAFSPNGLFMYVSFQSPGHIFEIRRTDGLPFNGQRLDIKYHSNADNTSPFRD